MLDVTTGILPGDGMTLSVLDRCNCSTRSGTFEVMEKKGHGRSSQVRLRNCSDKNDTFWVYEALCSATVTQRYENLRSKRLAKEAIVNKILSKQKR